MEALMIIWEIAIRGRSQIINRQIVNELSKNGKHINETTHKQDNLSTRQFTNKFQQQDTPKMSSISKMLVMTKMLKNVKNVKII